MAGKKSSGLLAQLADLEDPTPKDFDPEDERPFDSEEDQSGDSEEPDDHAEDAARDHYVSVSKSKLRKSEGPNLGPRYTGSRVSREVALEEDDQDDPFARGFDDDPSSDDDGADATIGKADLVESGASDGSSSGDVDRSESMSDDEDDTEGSSDDGNDIGSTVSPAMSGLQKASSADASIARKLLAQNQKSVVSTISQAAKDEAEKGDAVKKQRNTFDNLLNMRIKLQKAIIGTNTLSGLARDSKLQPTEDLESAFKSAESAAFTLWDSLTKLRDSLQTARGGSKRKLSDFAVDSLTPDLLKYNQTQDSASRQWQDSTLEKWYARTHVDATAGQNRNKLSQTTTTSSPRASDPDVADEDEQVRRRDTGDPTIYDDADFYSVLLSTLLEQKSSFTPGANTQGKGPSEEIRGMNGYQIRREAKTKKVVDTKASKGRKLRYTVHEKLMNYCAPEDRGAWGERQIDDLFSSLLGRRVALESDGEDDAAADDGWAAVEEGEKTLLFGR
ncbi:apoptosis-antagonizing transcription factor [Elsinoe ampelina]|uniref:Protein BFR2 n=1 Tax=Elsinoe ampelina TaxID=302913 RepID=A0A6A6GPD1_9PEZI|nr:apoptosis-antagonizing transcription factor [Elsinoe ampelina]